MDLDDIRALALANGLNINQLTPQFYAFAKALLAGSMEYGDGYYDGFIAGAKHQEQHDLNTSSHHLTDAALAYSEDAEDKRNQEAPARRDAIKKKSITGVCARILKTSEQHKIGTFDSENNWMARCIADGRDNYLFTEKIGQNQNAQTKKL